MMTAETVFQLANSVTLVAWIALALSIIFKRDRFTPLIGFWVPLVLSALYAMLILLFFANADGGFDTLANVQRLFTSPWAALAGWVHYLAFDLYVGVWIAGETKRLSLPRWPLIALLPLTFMFGPMGFLGFHLTKFLFERTHHVDA
jgi:Domain of unknown function (DUF4281)